MNASDFVALGIQSFRERKADVALFAFKEANDLLDKHDDRELFLTANYYLGWLYANASNVEKADHHFGEVLAVDYEYKDTLARVENLQSGDD